MKYPRQISMPSGIQLWLEEQLEARGVDSSVYSSYILSALCDNSGQSVKTKDSRVRALIEELREKLKGLEEGQISSKDSSFGNNFGEARLYSHQEKALRYQPTYPRSTSNTFSSPSKWSGKRSFDSSVGKYSISEGNNWELNKFSINCNWFEEDKENNLLNNDAAVKIRSRSKIKQHTPVKPYWIMAKSLDCKDNKIEISKSQEHFQNDECNEEVEALCSNIQHSYDKSFGNEKKNAIDFQNPEKRSKVRTKRYENDQFAECDQELPLFSQNLESVSSRYGEISQSKNLYSMMPKPLLKNLNEIPEKEFTTFTAKRYQNEKESSSDIHMHGNTSGSMPRQVVDQNKRKMPEKVSKFIASRNENDRREKKTTQGDHELPRYLNTPEKVSINVELSNSKFEMTESYSLFKQSNYLPNALIEDISKCDENSLENVNNCNQDLSDDNLDDENECNQELSWGFITPDSKYKMRDKIYKKSFKVKDDLVQHGPPIKDLWIKEPFGNHRTIPSIDLELVGSPNINTDSFLSGDMSRRGDMSNMIHYHPSCIPLKPTIWTNHAQGVTNKYNISGTLTKSKWSNLSYNEQEAFHESNSTFFLGNRESRSFESDSWKVIGPNNKPGRRNHRNFSDVESTKLVLNKNETFISSIGNINKHSGYLNCKANSSHEEVLQTTSIIVAEKVKCTDSTSFGKEETVYENSNKEEILITQETHFKPIEKAPESNVEIIKAPAEYTFPDGTTFPISSNCDELNFHGSPGGGLYLEGFQYLNFNATDCYDSNGFKPKYRIIGNQKSVQTEDDFLEDHIRSGNNGLGAIGEERNRAAEERQSAQLSGKLLNINGMERNIADEEGQLTQAFGGLFSPIGGESNRAEEDGKSTQPRKRLFSNSWEGNSAHEERQPTQLYDGLFSYNGRESNREHEEGQPTQLYDGLFSYNGRERNRAHEEGQLSQLSGRMLDISDRERNIAEEEGRSTLLRDGLYSTIGGESNRADDNGESTQLHNISGECNRAHEDRSLSYAIMLRNKAKKEEQSTQLHGGVSSHFDGESKRADEEGQSTQLCEGLLSFLEGQKIRADGELSAQLQLLEDREEIKLLSEVFCQEKLQAIYMSTPPKPSLVQSNCGWTQPFSSSYSVTQSNTAPVTRYPLFLTL